MILAQLKAPVRSGWYLSVLCFFNCLTAAEATYTYPVDTSMIDKKWILSGGAIDNDIECPTYRIEFEGEILSPMEETPQVEYRANGYSYNNGCNHGSGSLVYYDDQVIGFGNTSTSKYCNYSRNDTLKRMFPYRGDGVFAWEPWYY